MSEKKLAYDFWNTPDGIRSQKIFDMRDRIRRLEASNKELRGMVCEFAHYLACPAYVFRPETVKTIIDIAAEERESNENERLFETA